MSNRMNEAAATMANNLRLAKSRKWYPYTKNLLEKKQFERAAVVARLLENNDRWMKRCLSEDVRMLNVGSFDRFAFPLIRAVYPNLVSTDLVSMQPMLGPTSQLFYLDSRYAVTKGSAKAGDTAMSALSGFNAPKGYPSENIDAEVIGTGDDSAVAFSNFQLAWFPIRRNSVTVVAGTILAKDNGNGALTGTGIASGTINYQTGVISVTFSVAPADGVEVVATYNYVSEGNTKRPELDIILTSQLITADTYTLNTNWTTEAEADFRAVHGIEAEDQLFTEIGQQLRFEIDYDITSDLTNIAFAGSVKTWDYTPPVGVDYYRHQLSFMNMIRDAQNTMFSNTRGRAQGNWIVCGTQFATVIESLPAFVKADQGETEGIVLAGQLAELKVYKSPWMTQEKAVLGHKGNTWLKAGYAYCPYVPLWRTPVVTLTDFKSRVGLMTRYAKKLVNGAYYMGLSIDNYGVLS